jgi:hypothetical protein
MAKLTFLGDYAAVKDGKFQVVTRIEISREWSNGNPGFSDRRLSTPVSRRVETPIVEILSPEEIVDLFQTNSDLKEAWVNGVFKYLVQAGTLPKCELISADEIKEKSLEAISSPVTMAELNDGDQVYFASRRLAAHTILGMEQSNALELFQGCIKSRDWYPSLKVCYVGIGLLESEEIAVNKGLDWAVNSISNGWSLLAGVSLSDEAKIANSIVIKNNESRHIGLLGNKVLAMAIMAPAFEADCDELKLAIEESQSQYYFIRNCGQLALSILQSQAELTEGLTETFSQVRTSLERGYNHKTTPKELLTLAISAQTLEEIHFAFMTATHYFQDTMKATLRSHALTALAILSLEDRSVIGNLVALNIEYHDPLGW